MAKPMVRQSAPIRLCARRFFCIRATITVHLSSPSSGYSRVMRYCGLCQKVSAIQTSMVQLSCSIIFAKIKKERNRRSKVALPKKFRHPPAVTPRTHSPSKTLISHFFFPALRSSSVRESGFKLQISSLVK